MREIRFSQTHRRTGERRRFVIAQMDRTGMAPAAPADTGAFLSPVARSCWHYVAQLGDMPWTEFRRLDASLDAPDAEVRRLAIRDFNVRARKREIS